MHGGELIAEVLKAHRVPFLFTLCGGHISPILSACKQRNIRVVDVRHEATAVFAADAVSRLGGIPGVAVVTAGPGVANTITAVKNARLAQSPLVLVGGAAATALRGRGALQDIDQLALMKSCVKWQTSLKQVRQLGPAMEEAFYRARQGIPGPVFVECPVDLLYEERLVRELYGVQAARGRGLANRAMQWYLKRHVERLFAGVDWQRTPRVRPTTAAKPSNAAVASAIRRLARAKQPVLLIGSQAAVNTAEVERLVAAVEKMGLPVYLSGTARGLLGKGCRLQMRHQRRKALKEADLVLLAGIPNDFRLDYGRHVRSSATLISVNLSKSDLNKNRRPDLGVLADPALFLSQLAEAFDANPQWEDWIRQLRERDEQREAEIARKAEQPTDYLNPLRLCRKIEQALPQESVLVADGGDFIAVASYILSPRQPLSWLDPGVFGTLGGGAGFAIGAKLVRPEAEVWLLYGDGAAGFSLMDFDSLVRHQLPVIAVVGNDGGWTQIAREQVEILHDDVGTVLNRSDYHRVAEALGGSGMAIRNEAEIAGAIETARSSVAQGKPALINAWLGKTDFRKGSISM